MTRLTQLTLILVTALALAGPVNAQAQAQVESAPLMTEELLDLMLRQCRSGQGAQALQLAQDIREQLPTTATIDALLAPVLEGACTPMAPTSRQELHMSFGWDDNANLGLLSNAVTFQSPGQPVTYLLDDSYKPVSSAYLGVTGMHEIQTTKGWTVQTLVGVRQLFDYSPLNTQGLQISGRRSLNAWGMPGHLTLGWAESWLGGSHFRSAPSVSWQSQPSRGLQGWVFNIAAQHHDYANNTFDARQLQAGITHLSRLDANTQISWGGGLLHDKALGTRAGGTRQGANLQASWQHALQDSVWTAQWALHQWTSVQDFLPGLMDYRRNNRTTTAIIGYQRPLRTGGVGYIEYQHRNSRDNVPLYAHRSNQLGVGWMLRWP